ncbi:helix-turn-helix domain-containing protein [Streptomyces sp. NPDC017958]|uniref:helix-turn-helix domain-containing protein n=1 Tax=Streptomyces sp. NPDC017958 TaxID=3365021 RepID=UPI0037B2D7BC
MTATTSPSNWASPSTPPAPEATDTGPDASRADSPSSSTPSHSYGAAEECAERIRSELAGRLCQLRRRLGWSLYEAEQRTGVSRSTLSRLERNQTEPTISAVVRACHAYGYPVSQLLAEAEASALSAAEPHAADVLCH